MKIERIQVVLNPSSAAGTRAVVFFRRWFFARRAKEYVCHKAGPIMGAEWVDPETGLPADDRVSIALNDAAQAARNLSLVV